LHRILWIWTTIVFETILSEVTGAAASGYIFRERSYQREFKISFALPTRLPSLTRKGRDLNPWYKLWPLWSIWYGCIEIIENGYIENVDVGYVSLSSTCWATFSLGRAMGLEPMTSCYSDKLEVTDITASK